MYTKIGFILLQGSVKFNVHVPSMPDKPEFNLKGQTLSFSLPYTDNVSIPLCQSGPFNPLLIYKHGGKYSCCVLFLR